MKKSLVAALVLALGATGFFLFRGTTEPSKAETSASNAAPRASGEARRRPAAPLRMRSQDQPVAPKRYSGNGTAEPGTTRSYTRNDGSEVRDHRANAPEPNLERHMTMPREISKIQPETLRAVRLALRPAMNDCLENHAADAESGSKAQATLTVSVKDETLRVDTLNFQSEGLPPDADEALRGCATAAMVGHEQALSGSEDVKKHVMTFPYDL